MLAQVLQYGGPEWKSRFALVPKLLSDEWFDLIAGNCKAEIGWRGINAGNVNHPGCANWLLQPPASNLPPKWFLPRCINRVPPSPHPPVNTWSQSQFMCSVVGHAKSAMAEFIMMFLKYQNTLEQFSSAVPPPTHPPVNQTQHISCSHTILSLCTGCLPFMYFSIKGPL